MKLRAAMSLLAGGPGSGCNPDVGKCGRPPEMHKGESGTSYAHRLSEWDRSRKIESRLKKMEPVLKEFKFKKSGENSIDLIYRRGSAERLSIDKRTGRATIQKTSYKGVRRNTMEYRTPVSANTPDTLRKQLKELFGGGPGSGCNPEAGKCGRTAEERTGKEGRALDRARKDPRQTSLYGPEHEKELQKPIVNRSKDFRTTGEYEVQIGHQSFRMYRDPESKLWYEAGTGKHFSQAYLGYNKEEALKRLMDRVNNK